VRELPTGTVTFLFTDIEGSTRLLRELGDGYAEALAEHRRLLREVFAAHGGVEVDTQGDAFFVAFARAGEALAAAREGQAALGAGPIRVRMGLHTGEPLVTDEGYVGLDVHRAARIAAVGHGGQVLLSQSTRELSGPDGLVDLGEHRLKDLTAPERLYQLGEEEFPPLKSLNQSNLPQQPTPFVGREKELAEVMQLVGDPDVRLLTLTGAGGSGKTRLAVQAAAEAVEAYEHGVWWVGLQTVRDPDLVLPAISSALGAKSGPAEHIGDRRVLLVLDNLEQVVAAAAALGDFLAACPNLKLVATSREPLRLAAEQEYAVPPFVEQESVGFFLARARAVRADFQPDDHVLEICRRLDHLPLALELAAARVRALSSAQILERLERSLPLLTGGVRDAPERQRTLRATIAWSYDLLSPEEQEVFRRLAVFSGGCTLEAAEQIAGAGLDTLESLVAKSLLRFEGERYSMLETIREFALERLEESGEAAEIRRRHGRFFLGFAEAANMSAEGDYGHRYDLVPPDQDNLRAAIDRAVESGDVELGLRIAVALENFWVMSDPFEGVRRFEAMLGKGEVPDLLRARALRCYAGSLFLAGHYEQSHRVNLESLALFRALGDDQGVAVLLHRIGISTLQLGDSEKAREILEESRRLFRQTGVARGEAEAIGGLGYVAHVEGDLESATDLFFRSAEMAGEIGFAWWQVGMLLGLVECLVELGRIDEAEASAREELALAREIADRQSMVFGLVHFAWIASVRGDSARAGRFWGAVEAEEARAPIGQWEDERENYAERVLGVGGPELERSRLEGRRLSFESTVDEALS
jgi:predicted ATPase